jgi:hypothetical protein
VPDWTRHCARAERQDRIGSKAATKPTIAPPSTPGPPSAQTHTDMDIQKPFSKLKKKIKHRLAGSKHKQGRTGADTGGEIVDGTGSVPQPEPHVLVGGGNDQEEGGSSAVGERVFSTNGPSQPDKPEPVPTRGTENDQAGGEADVDGREGGQRYSVGSGVIRGEGGADGGTVEQVHPPPPTPLLAHGGRTDGMQA